jgi:hypothetical protein
MGWNSDDGVDEMMILIGQMDFFRDFKLARVSASGRMTLTPFFDSTQKRLESSRAPSLLVT